MIDTGHAHALWGRCPPGSLSLPVLARITEALVRVYWAEVEVMARVLVEGEVLNYREVR